MTSTRSGACVADAMHSHSIETTLSQELSSTRRPKVPASTKKQQRLPAADNPPTRPAHFNTKPLRTSTRDSTAERQIKSAPAVLEPWQRHCSFREVTKTNDEQGPSRIATPIKSAEPPKPAKTPKKKKAKKSTFLQQALAGTQSLCRTPQKPKAVVKQDNPEACAELLETAQKAEGVARRLRFAPTPKLRHQKRPADNSDRIVQSNLALNPTKFFEELEVSIPGVPQVHLAEYAKLFREAADPSIDTRDTEPAAIISVPDEKKKPLKRKQGKADLSADPSTSERRTRRCR
ncbi:hypothetical protein F5X68DRAFT_255134 [Plectosphaerella plurivora]|uniref:Uncharacterized protein n=1 Tax=Plectosphaerella plurivora TaxID=936078 RepID=A0A9P8VDX6_9PEZI|nr:hypothetical protein F5X68DRAFT_255134 [Plectosphaerella plurivora]